MCLCGLHLESVLKLEDFEEKQRTDIRWLQRKELDHQGINNQHIHVIQCYTYFVTWIERSREKFAFFHNISPVKYRWDLREGCLVDLWSPKDEKLLFLVAEVNDGIGAWGEGGRSNISDWCSILQIHFDYGDIALA